jgi:ABC-type sugar transport system permease subunit
MDMSATTVRTGSIKLERPRTGSRYFLGPLLVAPGLVLLIAILAYPIVKSIWISLFHYNLASFDPPTFIGVQNYIDAISDWGFLNALWHTLYIVVLSILIEFVLALALAHLFVQRFPGRRLMLGITLIPWMLAPAVVALTWLQLLNQTNGIFNHLLIELGIANQTIGWLTDPVLALHVMIAVDVWHETPFMMIILLAGLQGIDKEPYEAAIIDGANAWQCLRYITLPLLRPAIALALLMRTMMALRFFDIPWIMTGGGPAGATEVLGTQAYKAAFVGFEFGYGSTIATFVLVLSCLISVVYIRLLYRRQS